MICHLKVNRFVRDSSDSCSKQEFGFCPQIARISQISGNSEKDAAL